MRVNDFGSANEDFKRTPGRDTSAGKACRSRSGTTKRSTLTDCPGSVGCPSILLLQAILIHSGAPAMHVRFENSSPVIRLLRFDVAPKTFSTVSVKSGKAQTEQMFSGLCLKADARRLWLERFSVFDFFLVQNLKRARRDYPPRSQR